MRLKLIKTQACLKLKASDRPQKSHNTLSNNVIQCQNTAASDLLRCVPIVPIRDRRLWFSVSFGIAYCLVALSTAP